MKSPLLIKNILFLAVIIILVVECMCEGSNPNNVSNPKIESKWQMSGNSDWYLEGKENLHQGVSFQNDQNDMILNSSVGRVELICSADYPVYWTYDLPEKEEKKTPDVYLHRTSQDFNDPQTYKFYSHIKLSAYIGESGLSTGTYTCRSANEVELQTTRFIYWEGATRKMVYGEDESEVEYNFRSPFNTIQCATPSCIGLPSKTVQADKDNQTVILPCAVNSPLTKVKLYKKSENTTNTTTATSVDYKEIEWNKGNTTTGITFDPKVGFILNVTEQLTPPYGIYKCNPEPPIIDETTTEVLIVNVTTGVERETKIENDIRSGNAKYFFDTFFRYSYIYRHTKFDRRITCCSNGTNPPKIYKTFCPTKYECTTARQQLQEFKYPETGDIRSGHCRSFGFGSTHSLLNEPVIGVFRCVGEGIDVTREFYVPPAPTTNIQNSNGSQPTIYYDNEISGLNTSDLLDLSSLGGGSVKGSQLFAFTNQSLDLLCDPSNYLFALGVRWSIVWQNGTTQLVPVRGTHIVVADPEAEIINELKVKASKDIHSVTCHAPLFNSSEWIDKTFYFNVTDAEAPKIQGPAEETITWRIGDKDKELNCEATGFPTPTFTWVEPVKYDGYTGTFRTSATWTDYDWNRVKVEGEGKSSLKFKQVLSTMGGEYTCYAVGVSSLGHYVSAVKSFTVKVTTDAALIDGRTAGTKTTV